MIKSFKLSNGLIIPSDNGENQVLLFINPDADEKRQLLNNFEIDEHTLHSALDPDEVSRIEFTNSGFNVIWSRPMNYSGKNNFLFNVTTAGIFLFKKQLVLVLSEEISFTGVKKVQQLDSLLDIVLNILYDTIHHYIEHLKVIRMISRELQAKINTSLENKHLIQMFNLTESLVYYLNGINANSVVLSRLKTYAEKSNYSSKFVEFIDDLVIENNQCYTQAEIYSRVLSGLMDARGNIVNNNMNMLLKNLMIITVIFLPLNLIASIGGMSEFTMMTEGIHWWVSYSFFIVSLIIIGLFTTYFLQWWTVNRKIKKSKKK
ncbi:MAG: magnesium transporter [Chlorobiaceae bacterium]|nr:magnesium transporter [Chlorobiaceae bacterium]MBA4310337.1 magnesium transporter [Chlorobiaceae bacterium]